jgi:hypothetical protein
MKRPRRSLANPLRNASMSFALSNPARSWGRGALVMSLALASLVGAAYVSGDAGASTLSASSLMSLALKNAVKAGWVHEVESASAPGHSFSMDNDIGTSEGRQIIDSNGAHAKVIVLNKTAYIYGDKKAVADYFQLSTTDPAKFANKWLSIGSTSSGYSTVSDAVTLASDFTDVTIPGKVTQGSPVLLNGRKVIPIHGTAAATSTTAAIKATLYVTTSTPRLPVELHLVSKSETVTASWTKWGHAVDLKVPPNVTPLTQQP